MNMAKYKIDHFVEMKRDCEYPIALCCYEGKTWLGKDKWVTVKEFRTEQEAHEFYEKIRYFPLNLPCE